MEASDLFAYPTGSPEPSAAGSPQPPAPPVTFLDEADEREWDALLSYMETQHLYEGETLFEEGHHDRALYLLTVGRIELTDGSGARDLLEAPAPINEVAFLDGGRCPATARAASEVELLRLSFDAFESLAFREPVLGRKLLLDLARMLARALRSAPG